MFAGFDWKELPFVPVAFVLLATLWGGSFVAIETGVREAPPLLFAAIRYDIAGVLVLGAAAFRDRWVPRTRDDIAAILIVGTLVIAGHHALLYLGQQTVPGAIAAAIVALAPVLTALAAGVLLPADRLSPVQYAGVTLGFLGVFAVTSPGTANGVPLEGALTIFAATGAFAVGSLLLRRVRPRISLGGMQGWGMLLGSVLLHAGSLLRGESQAVDWSPEALAALAFLVVGPGVVAFLLYFELLGRVGPTQTNLVAYLEPVAAAALSFLLFGYVPTLAAILGFALVFAGFALVKRDLVHTFARRARTTLA